MKKIIVLLLIILVPASIWYWGNRSLHQPISVNNVVSIKIWTAISGFDSRKAAPEEIQNIVKWFNSSNNIRQNKYFAGITPYAGIIIELKTGKQINIINSGEDFEVQRYVGFKKVSYWAKQKDIRELLAKLASGEI
ncbi:MAG: hypothetical protein A4E55_01561 [Pelotomaculum sp. PtaU1.Bin035]|nr:MAG: hypothetical protein A4E55_01561 [Pelotomaculum sp. PtaU1.Bin035]